MKIYSEAPSLDEAEDCSEEEPGLKELAASASPAGRLASLDDDKSEEVEAAELACSLGRLELCEAAEEEEEIEIDDWELSDDVIEEEEDSIEEDRLDELPSSPTLEDEEDVATVEELEEDEPASPAGRLAGWLEDEELTV